MKRNLCRSNTHAAQAGLEMAYNEKAKKLSKNSLFSFLILRFDFLSAGKCYEMNSWAIITVFRLKFDVDSQY